VLQLLPVLTLGILVLVGRLFLIAKNPDKFVFKDSKIAIITAINLSDTRSRMSWFSGSNFAVV